MIFIFVGLFGFFFTLVGLYVAKRASRARSWPSAIGKVIKSEVREEVWKRQMPGRGQTTSFRPYVEYVYKVNGRDYQSHILSFSGEMRHTPQEAAELLKKYQNGAQVEVKYSPENPADSVLITTISGNVIGTMVIGLALICLGVVGFTQGW